MREQVVDLAAMLDSLTVAFPYIEPFAGSRINRQTSARTKGTP